MLSFCELFSFVFSSFLTFLEPSRLVDPDLDFEVERLLFLFPFSFSLDFEVERLLFLFPFSFSSDSLDSFLTFFRTISTR